MFRDGVLKQDIDEHGLTNNTRGIYYKPRRRNVHLVPENIPNTLSSGKEAAETKEDNNYED